MKITALALVMLSSSVLAAPTDTVHQLEARSDWKLVPQLGSKKFTYETPDLAQPGNYGCRGDVWSRSDNVALWKTYYKASIFCTDLPEGLVATARFVNKKGETKTDATMTSRDNGRGVTSEPAYSKHPDGIRLAISRANNQP